MATGKRIMQTAMGLAFVLASLQSLQAVPLSENAPASQALDRRASAPVQFSQSGCWFAVMSCSRSRADAQRFEREFGGDMGRVINTSGNNYPNFQPGYFCFVDGPGITARKRIGPGASG